MRVPIDWLKDFVNINMSVSELADKLISCGFEIEEIIDLRDKIKNVVTGKIVSIEKHPNADKLSVCQVDINNKDYITIVTNATNIEQNDIVPVALDGAVLADDIKIKAGKIRGILSRGMFCGGEELDLHSGNKAATPEGIFILEDSTPIGEDINNIIGNDDIVLDISITANRQDCNSILGIAREVAAVTNQKIKMPSLNFAETTKKIEDYLTVENKNYELCSRYMAKIVENIKIVQSPMLIRKRLRAVGIRPINNIVDITNYVLIEIGQPLHAFDLNLLEGNKIVVRNAIDTEKIVALDGKEYTLTSKNLLICDAQKPVAVAGVMGGEFSSVTEETKTIALESANFAKDSVRHTSKQLNLRSDSSQRFEKGIDLLSQQLGLYRALSLIDKYKWGEVVCNEIDNRKVSLTPKTIKCDYNQINAVLGIEISSQRICKILNSLDINTRMLDKNIMQCILPLFRTDIAGVNDLAEEVIRIYGYEKLVPSLLKDAKMIRGGKTAIQKNIDKLKMVLVSHGLYEIISYSFISPKAFDMLCLDENSPLRTAIKLRNPLGEDLSIMRTTLAYSMIKTMASNIMRGNKSGKFFEYAKIYKTDKKTPLELPKEEYNISLGVYGEEEDFYSLKAVLDDTFAIMGTSVDYQRSQKEYLHPGRGADILDNNGKLIGYIGEVLIDVASNFDIDKKMYIAELSVEYILQSALIPKEFLPISKYQFMERDLALIMDKHLEIIKVLEIIKEKGTTILEDINVFDVYEGSQISAGKKSVAINLRFRHQNRTLKEKEVNDIIESILKSLANIDVILR